MKNDADMMLYAGFGANTNMADMAYRCPDAVHLGKAILPNYEFKFKRHADVEPKPGSLVECVLWKLSKEDLKRMDHFEGYPEYYKRKFVPVEFNGKTVEAIIYYMNGHHECELPDDYYLELLRSGYKENGLNMKQIDKALAECETE